MAKGLQLPYTKLCPPPVSYDALAVVTAEPSLVLGDAHQPSRVHVVTASCHPPGVMAVYLDGGCMDGGYWKMILS